MVNWTKTCLFASINGNKTLFVVKYIYLKDSDRISLETICRYLDAKLYSDALTLSSTLLKELKKLDDKVALLEVQLLESKVYHQLRNLAKSRVWHTSFFHFDYLFIIIIMTCFHRHHWLQLELLLIQYTVHHWRNLPWICNLVSCTQKKKTIKLLTLISTKH